MKMINQICTLKEIEYYNAEYYFGFIAHFEKEDGITFNTGDTYIANTEIATPFTKAYVFDKMVYCIQKTRCYDLRDIKDKKVRIVYDNGSFLGFWFVEDK